MASVAAFCRRQNAIKYCTQLRKTGAACIESNNSAIARRRNAKFNTDIHTDALYNCTGYDITSDFRSDVIANKTPATSDRNLSKFEQTAKNATYDGFWVAL